MNSLCGGYSIAPLAAFAREPWRNGGGTTRRLAQHANGDWRISLADVTCDGPYSRFEGMTRLSLILQGAGITLRHAAYEVDLGPQASVTYDGDIEWMGTLRGGPVLALNAMAFRGRFSARIELVSNEAVVPAECFGLLIALDADCMLQIENRETAPLKAGYVLTHQVHGPAVRCIKQTEDKVVVMVIIEPTIPDEADASSSRRNGAK